MVPAVTIPLVLLRATDGEKLLGVRQRGLACVFRGICGIEMHNSNVGKKIFPQFIFLLKKITEHQMPTRPDAPAAHGCGQSRCSRSAGASKRHGTGPGSQKASTAFQNQSKKNQFIFLGTSCHLNVSRTLRIDLMCEWTLGGGRPIARKRRRRESNHDDPLENPNTQSSGRFREDRRIREMATAIKDRPRRRRAPLRTSLNQAH